MKLTYILAFLSVIAFVIMFISNKTPRKFYILFPLYIFPLIDLPISPVTIGNLSVFDGVSYIAFIFLFKDFLLVEKRTKIYLFLLCLLVIILLLGSLSSEFVKTSLFNILTVFPIFIYSKSVILECSKDEKFKNKIIFCLKLAGTYAILFLIVQLLIGLNFTFYTQLNKNTQDAYGLRYPSFFQEPQKFQQFLAMLSFLCLINPRQIEKPTLKNYLAFGVLIIGMVATGGRSAFIGLFVGLLILFFILSNQYKKTLVIISSIGFILLLCFPSSFLVLNRSKTFSDDLSYRASLWDDAYNIYKSHPLVGIGLGNFKDYMTLHSANYYITPDNEVIFPDQPESGYWKILTETGTLGFLVIFIFILAPLFTRIKDYFRKKKDLMNFFFISALISWLISFTSVYSISDKRILIVVLILICFLISNNKSYPKYGI